MSNSSQSSPGGIPEQPQKPMAPEQAKEAAAPIEQEYLRQLEDTLRHGVLVENSIWSFKMTDWVVGLCAADIDGDGDREILIASRDGWIKAFTRYGSLKWDRLLDKQHLSSLAVRHPDLETAEEPRIILGLRSGKVIALNKDGSPFPAWEYDTGRIIRQIAISEQEPDMVVIGSEDRCVHVLDGATGTLRWKYPTNGWVRCVCVADIDGDGQVEILAGSGDQNIYIFNTKGELLFILDVEYQIYALAAAPLEKNGPVTLITSSNHKNLSAWQVTRLDTTKAWQARRLWLRSSRDEERLFENRVHSICIADLNKDGNAVILAGCEDGHLAVLDRFGKLLWKRDCGACASRVDAVDLNYDGQIKVLVGTEDNYAYVFQLELVEDLYARLQALYQAMPSTFHWQQFAERLPLRERALLKDLASEPPPRPRRLELEQAKSLVQQQQYEQALTLLLRLLQQRVQYCWSQPFQTKGYVWTGFFAAPAAESANELLVGSDRGSIYALDISQPEAVPHWQRNFAETDREQMRNRVRMIAPGPTQQDGSSSIIAILASQRVLLLDHEGNLLQNHKLTQEESWPRSASFSAGDETAPGEILLGMENQRISIWDNTLSTQIGEIPTPQGIGVACAYDLLENGTTQIIAGALKNCVYAYTREGEQIWRFPTKDRIQALHVADIDLDGHAEVIVGSEDRNIYVLDYEGHLKWRYPTGRGVMSIDVCDVKVFRDSDAPLQPTPLVLVSSADGYLYIFGGHGDLFWKYQFPNRVRMVRGRDNGNGRYELAVAYEDQLELLQILDKDELLALIDTCWKHLTTNYTDRVLLRQFTAHHDEYIRGYALAILAGTPDYEKEDIQCIHKALREDNSLQVKRELVGAIVNFCRIPANHPENVNQARQLLEGLYRDPAKEVRLELVHIYPLLAGSELFFRLFFENLERSTDHADEEVRRAVVRRLDLLIEIDPERYPKRVFSLLLKTARDETTWIRQETGRALAHYFERHIHDLVADLVTLLGERTDLMILEQITYSSRHKVLKGLFQNMRRQLLDLHRDNLVEILDEAILYLDEIRVLKPLYGEERLQMYEEFRQFARSRTISALAGYQRVTRSDTMLETPLAQAGLVMSVFNTLEEVAHTVALYERRQTVGERVTTLIQAQHFMEELRSALRQPVSTRPLERQEAHAPENRILALLVDQWWEVINKELARISGSARLELSLSNSITSRAQEIIVSLQIKNDGQCAADNIRIEMGKSPDYEIIGDRQKRLTEISTRSPVIVDFHLRIYQDATRVAFDLTYDDAERKNKEMAFADEVVVQRLRRPYHQIANPYTTGTPIREKEMFYGRTEDLLFLQTSLERRSANRVVLLWGQRRMGKTSLIYRLVTELAIGPYSPVFIDLQQFALKSNDAQLLESFARCICSQIWQYKKTRLAEPVHEFFASDPSAAFYQYLTSVWQQLPNERVILLIDEFDEMGPYIARNGDGILRYLRNLMQHYPGLNFLLAGAPQMPYVEGYQAIFFNIAQPRQLGKFKRDEAIELIVEPVSGDLEYDPLALEKMMAITDGWPYFIHVMGEKLIQHCNAIQRSYVTVGEVNAALDLVLLEQDNSIRWIWQDLSSPLEKLILSLLAQEKGEEGRVFSLNDLQRNFDVHSIIYEHKELTEALSRLVKGSFVEELFDGVQYQIPVGLVKAWLRKKKPPERVIREENFFADEHEF